MNEIKLIIWDLDETFWHGTLSEEGITVNNDNVELIRKLTSRGVINSISSKNNHDDAKYELEKLGLWEYFVFPKIGWYSKGNAIKMTIEEMGLRPVNVLFIDDNHLNLKEASSLLPSINVLHPEDLGDLDKKYSIKGKDDATFTRLAQYKILEAKVSSRTHYETDLDFLSSCDINVQIRAVDIEDLIRVHELIQRTNQLNFTKIRLELEEVKLLITSPIHKSHVVFVNDKYGDYGLVGFVALEQIKNKLEHFCFSCRTINLGVEQFIYDYLNYPDMDVVGDTAIKLVENYKPCWIELCNKNLDSRLVNNGINGLKILFKGGCDLSQMTFYLNEKNNVIEETNFVTKGNLSVHAEHSYIVLNETVYDENMPYLPIEAFDSIMFKESFDYVIYSVLMDYTQDLYMNSSGNIVPFGGYSKKIDLNKLSSNDALDMKNFYRNHNNIGPIKAEKFHRNLQSILNKLDKKTKLILINGAEVAPIKNMEYSCVERHKLMNKIVDTFCENNRERVTLIDVRNHITSSKDLTDNLRHYNRSTYKNLAEDISKVLNLKIKKGNATLIFYSERLVLKIKSQLDKMFSRVK